MALLFINFGNYQKKNSNAVEQYGQAKTIYAKTEIVIVMYINSGLGKQFIG